MDYNKFNNLLLNVDWDTIISGNNLDNIISNCYAVSVSVSVPTKLACNNGIAVPYLISKTGGIISISNISYLTLLSIIYIIQ